MAARLLFGLPAQLASQVLEPVQGGIDADIGELGLDYLQVKVPDVVEDAAHPPGRVVPSLAGGSGPRAGTKTCLTLRDPKLYLIVQVNAKVL
jgi:hypothetical protein